MSQTSITLPPITHERVGAMTDIVDSSVRSNMMRAVPQLNSKPEMVVRRLAHELGYRYRLHVRKLAGSPDIVFPRLKKVIFVHGCFWHRHRCKRATTPATRKEFWGKKFEDNKARDKRNNRTLRRDGWSVLVVWECWTRRPEWLEQRLTQFLAG